VLQVADVVAAVVCMCEGRQPPHADDRPAGWWASIDKAVLPLKHALQRATQELVLEHQALQEEAAKMRVDTGQQYAQMGDEYAAMATELRELLAEKKNLRESAVPFDMDGLKLNVEVPIEKNQPSHDSFK
jgi:hypothetical protein